MRITAGQSCTAGFRIKDVNIDTVRIIAPPISGEVTIKGPGFSYKAEPNFQGQDSFTVMISGNSKKVPGLSIVRVLISVQNPKASHAGP
jgi:hypothetical protein